MNPAFWLIGLVVPGLFSTPFYETSRAQQSDQADVVELLTPLASGSGAPEGHYVVTWQVPGVDEMSDSLRFAFQFGTDPTFATFDTRNVGSDRATFLSGLPPGSTFVRVRIENPAGTAEAPWSDVGLIAVSYPGMGMVKILAALGITIFIVLIGIIWRGHRTTETMNPEVSAS